MIIHKYEAPWTIYGMHWSTRKDSKFRLALGSFIEEYNNKVQIVNLEEVEDIGEEANALKEQFSLKCQFDHPYPCTKISWIPDRPCNFPDLLATSGDYLRIWRINKENGKEVAENAALLNNNRHNNEYCAPLTSFDWNEIDPTILGTSSIDTTCTIWNIETGQSIGTTAPTGKGLEAVVKTQLIAHDKEVYDISFSRGVSGRDQFASVGADGSVRMFDLRALEHSTIIFESAQSSRDQPRVPLVRLAWNKQDPNYLATMPLDSTEIIILDVRVPCTPVARLNNHRACVNGIAWAPHSSCHICTAGDDAQALIWDIGQHTPKAIEEPILAYTAGAEVNQVHWASEQPDWIAICFDKNLEILRV